MNQAFDPLGHETPEEDLKALARLAERSSDYSGCPEGIEVGSWAGGTALVLSPFFERLYCVDTWLGSPNDRTRELVVHYGPDVVFRTFCRNMGRALHRSIFPCRGPSHLWASVWSRKADLVFIDANHDYENVKEDILAWRPHVKPGGILCGHDYGVFEGVTRAVDELIPDRQTAGFCLWWTTISEARV